MIATEFVEKASWLLEDIEKGVPFPATAFALAVIQALMESLRRHNNDEPDLHDRFRRANLITMYQTSPVEQLFVAYFMSTAHCGCGKLHQRLHGTSLVAFDLDGRIQFPGHRPFQTCESCGQAVVTSTEIVQYPQYILVRVLTREPDLCSVEVAVDLLGVMYDCCGYIGQSGENHFVTWLCSGQAGYRYQHDDACHLETIEPKKVR